MKVRRVATGHDASGKAVVASDVEVDAATARLVPGYEFHKLWGADSMPRFPDAGLQPAATQYFPPAGGYRFMLFTVPPLSAAGPNPDDDPQAMLAEFEETLPGLAAHLEPATPGMHTSDTTDMLYLISGEVWLELDDGVEVHLRAGDAVVQNGTRHAWRNKGTEPCRMIVFMIGTPRSPSGIVLARRSA
jgi:uncharacterized cupin superfamily protein